MHAWRWHDLWWTPRFVQPIDMKYIIMYKMPYFRPRVMLVLMTHLVLSHTILWHSLHGMRSLTSSSFFVAASTLMEERFVDVSCSHILPCHDIWASSKQDHLMGNLNYNFQNHIHCILLQIITSSCCP